jgi:hypothetical protein
MRPWHHARATAATAERRWTDDLDIHEFLDISKVAFPDLRHRIILHSSDFGAALTALAFPERPDAAAIARAHIRQDLGCDMTLREWLAKCDPKHLPRRHKRSAPLDREVYSTREAARQKLADPRPAMHVWDILTLPIRFAEDMADSAWCILANALGPMIVRRIIGPPREIPGAHGRAVVFDPAWCAEGMIYSSFRHIPQVSTVATALRI